jgi:hypothetical protein
VSALWRMRSGSRKSLKFGQKDRFFMLSFFCGMCYAENSIPLRKEGVS